MFENEYETFANDCYDNHIVLAEAMKKEMRKVICNENSVEEKAEQIMELIFATRYEW